MLRRTGFFARLGARSVAPQRRACARRAARRREQWTWYVHNVFTEPTGRKSVPARAKRRRTRTRIARFITRRVVFFAHDIAPARLRHAYRVHVKSRPASKLGAWTLSTLLRRLFIGLTSMRAQLMRAMPGCICRSSPFSI